MDTYTNTQGSGTTNISLAGSSTGGFGMSFPSSYGPCEDMPDAIAGHGNLYGMTS